MHKKIPLYGGFQIKLCAIHCHAFFIQGWDDTILYYFSGDYVTCSGHALPGVFDKVAANSDPELVEVLFWGAWVSKKIMCDCAIIWYVFDAFTTKVSESVHACQWIYTGLFHVTWRTYLILYIKLKNMTFIILCIFIAMGINGFGSWILSARSHFNMFYSNLLMVARSRLLPGLFFRVPWVR